MVLHPDVRRSPRVKAVAEGLADICTTTQRCWRAAMQ
jgi:hypothetical protein